MPEKAAASWGSTVRARALAPGDRIGVVAPARWLADDAVARGITRLFGDRFGVAVSPQIALRLHQFAGDDGDRAAALEAMFADPAVAAIVCAKGGYGAPRLLDRLDYDLIRANPKRFVGYSDITALLHAIAQRAGLETYHGPMLVDAAGQLSDASCAHLVATLTDTPAPAAVATLLGQARVLRPGRATGRLLGGNLSLLVTLIGTATDIPTDGAILFIEDVDEHLYHLDRMLVHLQRAGRLARIAGLIVGEMRAIKDNAVPFGATVEDMVLRLIGDRAIPIVTNFPCGHGVNQMTLPIGARAHLECADGRIAFAVD